MSSGPWPQNCGYPPHDHVANAPESTAGQVDGPLHALVKIVDNHGQDMAQGVLPFPAPDEGSRHITTPLTLNTARAGRLACDVEISKVRRHGCSAAMDAVSVSQHQVISECLVSG
jgi:hypothetical protein